MAIRPNSIVMRFLFYSHDGMGLGHLRRNQAIAAALVELAPSARVLLATGADEVSSLGLPPNVDLLKLPGLRKTANNHYSSRRLGLLPDEMLTLRSQLLQGSVVSFQPDVVLVDKHPCGACGELRAAIKTARASGARVALGLRDILDDARTVLQEWEPAGVHQFIEDYYDRILVYGEPKVFDVAAEYRFPSGLVERTKYCGYVVNHTRCSWPPAHCPFCVVPERDGRPRVVATVGGGEDGYSLLKAFLGAAADVPWQCLAVTGPLVGRADLERLAEAAAAGGVALRTFVPCLPHQFSQTDCLVCMGGYNTLAEAVSRGVPSVCVPRTRPRTEQLLRAHLFDRLGLLEMIHPGELSSATLRNAIERALQRPRQPAQQRMHSALRYDGGPRAARMLLDLAAGPPEPQPQRLAAARADL